MTIEEAVSRIAELLVAQFEYDLEMMSCHPWMYWVGMIPITLYVVFFLVKWAVLTSPVWLPIALMIRMARR